MLLMLCLSVLLLLSVSSTLTEDVTPQYQTSLPFCKATNSFTPDLYKEVVKGNKGNFLVSPFSAETALAFVQSGCKNDTAQEIRKALHLPDDSQKTESSIQALLPLMTSDSYTLRTVNKIYIKDGLALNDTFKKIASSVYSAAIENIIFTKPDAAQSINNWVETQTEKKIHNLISPNVLDNKTRAILINALYFKAKWAIAFPPVHTAKADFYKSAKEVVQVDMMYLYDEYFNYFECPHLGAKILELPFKGEEAVMTIILPNDKDGLAALENQTDSVLMPHNVTKELVNVALPKFKIETKLYLRKVLKNLGVVKVFDAEQADLSGIAGQKGDLVLSKIVQKTFIDVGELGVEAAAATYIPVIVPDIGIIDTPKVFIADHPFVFYIKVQGVVLFVGRVLVPN